MDLNKIYDKLSSFDVVNTGNSVTVRTGFFNEKDLIKVFSGYFELYFKIDKAGLLEILNSILPKISQLPSKDSFSHMIDIFMLLQSEINSYFGDRELENRESYYMKNGENTENEYVRICSLSQIKGKGIAKCVEKASVANNILLILNILGIFNYRVNYLNALTSLNGSTLEGHAFLEFDRLTKNGTVIHVIYDVTNPEIVLLNDEEYYHPAIYSLNDEEFKEFMNGGSFDNSNFIMSYYYKTKGNRIYRGFQKASDYDNDLEKKINSKWFCWLIKTGKHSDLFK